MKAIIFVLAIFVVSLCHAQNDLDHFFRKHMKHRYQNEFNLSGFTGVFLGGPKNNIKAAMRDYGFSDVYKDPGTDLYFPHPISTYGPIYDVEASYYFSGISGVSLNYCQFDNVKVEGYDDIGSGNFIPIRNQLYAFSLSYVFHTSDNKNSVFAGPAYIIHDVTFLQSTSSIHKMGLYVGYTQRVFEWDHWFIAVKLNYRWSPKTLIGPFVESNKGIVGIPDPETYTSVFPATRVNTGCFNAGLSVGIRIL